MLALSGAALIGAACSTPTPSPTPASAGPATPNEAAQPSASGASPTAQPATNAAPSKSLQGQTVRFQDGFNNQQLPVAEKLAAQFTQETGITVKIEPTNTGWETRTVAAMAAGNAPDVINGWGPHFALFIEKGGFTPLDPYVSRDLTKEQIDDFYPSALQMWQINGSQWGLPEYTGVWGAFFNRRIFEEANAPLPNSDNFTWDDMLEAAKQVTKFDSSNKPIQFGYDDNLDLEFTVSCIIWSWGGEVHDPEDNSVCRLHEEPAMEAMQFLADMRWKHHVMPNPSEASSIQVQGWSLFATDKIGLRPQGSWYVDDNIRQIGDRFTWDAFMLPIGKSGKRATFHTTDAWGIFKGSKSPDASWEWLKFLVGPVFQEQYILQAGFNQPALRSLAPKWEEVIRKELEAANPALKSMKLDIFPRSFEFARPMVKFSNHSRAMEILKPALEQIYITGSAQVRDVIPEASKKVTEALQNE